MSMYPWIGSMYFLVVISCSTLRGMVRKEPSSMRMPEAIEGAPMSPKLVPLTKRE